MAAKLGTIVGRANEAPKGPVEPNREPKPEDIANFAAAFELRDRVKFQVGRKGVVLTGRRPGAEADAPDEVLPLRPGELCEARVYQDTNQSALILGDLAARGQIIWLTDDEYAERADADIAARREREESKATFGPSSTATKAPENNESEKAPGEEGPAPGQRRRGKR